MRVSIASVSIEELRMFNISARDILVFISKLQEFPKLPEEVAHNSVEIVYQRSDPNDPKNGTYDGYATFYQGEVVVTPKGLPFVTTFTPPEGCNKEESFQWLVTEAEKLSHAMTGGTVGIENIDDLPHFDKNGTYTITFIDTKK